MHDSLWVPRKKGKATPGSHHAGEKGAKMMQESRKQRASWNVRWMDGCTQTGNREASRPVGSQGVVWTDRPLSTSPSPPPACFLIPPSASFWGDHTVWKPCFQHTHTRTFPPFPHPLPASLACSRLVGIPTTCCAMIWLMEFDFQRGSLKRVWLFGTVRMGGGVLWGQRCLASCGGVLPIKCWKPRFPLPPEDERGCDRILHLSRRDGGWQDGYWRAN